MTVQSDTPTQGWFKSSRSSDNANCVEVRMDDDTVGVRDSKNPTGPTLAFTGQAWTGFLHALKADHTPHT
ncbi:DUF397 domain-containing protein [Micromonospora sp. NPDC000207]|uniref:DUF397 domain-containing protein n=1 Tax=Micromonospora sp. NPDC000207 TaxID=3154246 RepID=UPI00332485DE